MRIAFPTAPEGVEEIEPTRPTLRVDERAAGFTRDFFAAGKPVAAICHAEPATLTTSRKPDDLGAFCGAFVREFAAAGARAGSGRT